MMKKIYVYRVRDEKGKVIAGKLEMENAQQVVAYLYKRNYFIYSIREERVIGGWLKNSLPLMPVNAKEIIVFCRQLSVMINCGVPLADAVKILSEQAEQAVLKKIIGNMHDGLTQGKTLTEVMGAHQRIFSPFILQMIAAGEVSGSLDEILDQLALHLEKEDKIKEKVKTAMMYPLFIMGLCFMMAAAMIFFVMPIFAKVFADAHMILPLPTILLLGCSSFLQNFYWLIFIVFTTVVAVSVKLFSLPRCRFVFDKMILKFPIVGKLIEKASTARFTRMLGTMLRGGIPLTKALSVSKNVIGNRFLAQSLALAEKNVADGFCLSAVLAKENVFSPMVVKMVAIGEETGRLDVLLNKLADYYENDVEEFAARLNSLLEPTMVLIMGVIVGGIVIAVALPIFDSIMCGVGG